MSKLVRRAIIPAITLLVIICITILERTRSNTSWYDKSNQIYDSLTHFTFSSPYQTQSSSPNYQAPPSTPSPPQQQPSNQQGIDKQSTENEEPKEEPKEETPDPCTVKNPLNQGFIDLRGLSATGNENKPAPWKSRGYDSGKNFTIGICSNPFKQSHNELNEIQDSVNSTRIGAYYVDPKTNKYVSIGEYSTQPMFRGRKLTLTYENGSFCNAYDSASGARLRKSTILTFTCDREMSAKASVSYVGSANDCTFFFEVKSHHACPTAAKANNMAAAWIFLVIFLAALAVYFSGGLLYKHMKASKKVDGGVFKA
ncbi:MRL1 [Candida theae]|uniref:MRL1 n=1 Tax=Candida theae TaxID=1198502 RepID=A0AAD5BJ00_9ASCO|nr:MRL1 [Candida theae]KAI5967388.1 MRL1 [Candida theae]